MSKHTRFFALTLASVVCLAGCAKRDTKPAAVTAPTSSPPAQAQLPSEPPPEPLEPTDEDSIFEEEEGDPEPVATQAPAPPSACDDYKAMVRRVSTCDKISSAAREAYRSVLPAIDDALRALATPEAKAAFLAACQAGVEGLRQAAPDCL